MSVMEKINHPAAWTAESLFKNTRAWVYQLTDEDITELNQALAYVEANGLVVPKLGKEDFPIPVLMEKLKRYKQELDLGMGLFQLKGFPVERYSKDQASAIFWGLGMHFGKPWAQNNRGHLLGDVINEGKTIDDPSARGYQTTITLNMHTDGADLVGLLFLKQAPVGGESTVVSALSVYNLLAETNPAVLQHLLDTEFCIDWRNEERPGDLPFHRGKIFSRNGDDVTCFALTVYIQSAQRHAEARRLTEQDLAAIAAFEQACEHPSLLVSFKQQAGDIFFLNNHFHAHGRSSFTDAEDPKDRRHLRRLWLESDAWAGRRPPVMQNILDTSRHWERSDTTVQMWDKS